MTRLLLGLSHLRDHKFRHSFQDCLNSICSCGIEVETTTYFLLHCPNYLHERKILLDNIKSVLPNILKQSNSFIYNVLLFGDNLSRRLFKCNYPKCNNQLYNIYKKIFTF